MKRIFNLLKFVITAIAVLVAIAGIALAIIGIYEFVLAVSHVTSSDKAHIAGLIATGLLKTIDMFLLAIVFFVFSLGILVLFLDSDVIPIKLPEWLRIKTFIQLKVTLWEAILTTLVVSYLAGLAEKKFDKQLISLYDLILPGAILLIALSLFFLKKGENKSH